MDKGTREKIRTIDQDLRETKAVRAFEHQRPRPRQTRIDSLLHSIHTLQERRMQVTRLNDSTEAQS